MNINDSTVANFISEVFTRIGTTFNMIYKFIEPFIITGVALLQANLEAISFCMIGSLCVYMLYSFIQNSKKTHTDAQQQRENYPAPQDSNKELENRLDKLELQWAIMNEQLNISIARHLNNLSTKYTMPVNSDSQHTYLSNSDTILKYLTFTFEEGCFTPLSFQVPASNYQELPLQWEALPQNDVIAYRLNPSLFDPADANSLVSKITLAIPNFKYMPRATTHPISLSMTQELLESVASTLKHFDPQITLGSAKHNIEMLVINAQKLISNTVLITPDASSIFWITDTLGDIIDRITNSVESMDWDAVQELRDFLHKYAAECNPTRAEYTLKTQIDSMSVSIGDLSVASTDGIEITPTLSGTLQNFERGIENKSPLINFLDAAIDEGKSADFAETTYN